VSLGRSADLRLIQGFNLGADGLGCPARRASAPMALPATSAAPAPHSGSHDLVLGTIAGHAPSLLATARRYSLCADDAQDAYQRGLEIFLRHADGLDPAGAAPWLRTVIKHEALAVRAARLRIVGPAEADLDLEEARELPGAEERALSFERLQRSAEALHRLKPHELRALVLKAHGYSYQEISEITGWTYTKVNRCLTEGRRSFRQRFADIEAGRECERWSAVLSAAADGEAAPGDLLALRPHVRGCAACRATLRDYRMANRRVAAVVPLVAATTPSQPVEETPSLVMRLYEAVAGGLQERAAFSAQKLQAGVEAASAGKAAAVAASATALAGGGMAGVRGPLRDDPGRDGAKHHPGRVERDAGAGDRQESAPVLRLPAGKAAWDRHDDGSRRGSRRGDRDEGAHDVSAEFGPSNDPAPPGAPSEPAAAASSSAPDGEEGPTPVPDTSPPAPVASTPDQTSEFGP
jgi:RNA polymerase sigma factor (sigma-70 family)